MPSHGMPLHPDAEKALERAVEMVNGYKGFPLLQPEPRLFIQQAVLDSLALAPSPVSESWIRISLACVSGVARMVHTLGQPLTREHVFSEETQARYVQSLTNATRGSRDLYATRLEMTGEFLLHTTASRVFRQPTVGKKAEMTPLTAVEEADLWMWATGLRSDKRRHVVLSALTLALGCGLVGGEIARCHRRDIAVTATGVHVTATKKNGQTRLVTCRAEWEDRLAALHETIPQGRYFASPWREDGTPSANALWNANMAKAAETAPVEFTSTRLRTTWLCHHVAAGTPLKVLLKAAGVSGATHIHSLLPLMPEVPAETAAALMRGA